MVVEGGAWQRSLQLVDGNEGESELENGEVCVHHLLAAELVEMGFIEEEFGRGGSTKSFLWWSTVGNNSIPASWFVYPVDNRSRRCVVESIRHGLKEASFGSSVGTNFG